MRGAFLPAGSETFTERNKKIFLLLGVQTVAFCLGL